MEITYIAHARIPTQKAHGIAIMRGCQAFVRAGVRVQLVVPRRYNEILSDAHEYYAVAEKFPIIRLPVIDLDSLGLPYRLWFMIESVSFWACLFVWSLFQSRRALIYTRSVTAVLLTFLGFRVVYEMHTRPRHAFLLHLLARLAYRVVVISEGLKKDLTKAGVADPQILVAPSGVDLSIFDIELSKEGARRALNLSLKGSIAVYTGNFTTMGEDKGLEHVIAALKHMPDVTFVAVGGSTPEIERYSQLAKDADVVGQLVLRGNAPQHELAKYQKAADVLLMPFPDTTHYRTYMSPVKMFEYMASGRPIVTSDLPTIREVLNSKNAILVPPGDVTALSGAIQEACSDPMRAESVARQAREDVTRFSWDARAHRILGHISV